MVSKPVSTREGGGDDDRAPSAGLRERKAAATRLGIVRALRERLATEPLAAVTADALANEVGISRVTFFNYFPTKEHALDLVLVAWLYEEEVASRARGLRGRAAIEHLFERMGAFVHEGPMRARTIIGYFSSRPTDRALPALGASERMLVAPGGPHFWGELETLGARFMRHVEEARADEEITREGTVYELAHLLGTLLLGSALVGHSARDQDWRRIYRHHVKRALGPAPTEGAAKAKTKTKKKREGKR